MGGERTGGRQGEGRGPRVLVTGAGGFVGRRLCAALARRGAQVVAAGRGGPGPACNLLDAADRRRLAAGARAEVLVHLAWVTEHGAFWDSPLNDAWLAASVDLFEAFYAAGGARIVGVGTCAEYDWATADAPLRETAALRPTTPYGAAKARAGEALAALAEASGGAAAWARLFHLYGEGEPVRRLVPAMISAALRDQTLACGPAEAERDFWDARDLGEALAALALDDLAGPINVAGGAGVSFGRLAGLIGEATGRREAIRLGARALTPGEPLRLVADAARLRAELGFEPAISLETGLADYVAALRARGDA